MGRRRWMSLEAAQSQQEPAAATARGPLSTRALAERFMGDSHVQERGSGHGDISEPFAPLIPGRSGAVGNADMPSIWSRVCGERAGLRVGKGGLARHQEQAPLGGDHSQVTPGRSVPATRMHHSITLQLLMILNRPHSRRLTVTASRTRWGLSSLPRLQSPTAEGLGAI